MGVFSKIHRYRDAGQDANVNNVERFGQPARSLFTSAKIFSLHGKIDITDSAEHVVYRSRTKIVSLHDRTVITDANDKEVAELERKLISIHQRHTVTMADGFKFDISSELLHIVKEVMNIKELGWQLRGNLLELNFELYDSNGDIVANIGQKIISLHDKYCIDIYQPEEEQKVIALLIVLEHMIRDRQAAAASASISS